MKPEDPANLQVGAWAALASRVPGARLGTAGAGGPLTRSVTRSTRSSTLTHAHTHAHWGMRLSPQAPSHTGLSFHTRSQKHSQGTHWLAHSLHTHSCLPPCPLSHSYTLSRTSKLYPSHSHTNAPTACYTHSNAYLLLT